MKSFKIQKPFTPKIKTAKQEKPIILRKGARFQAAMLAAEAALDALERQGKA